MRSRLIAALLAAALATTATGGRAQPTRSRERPPGSDSLAGHWRVFIRPMELWRHIDLAPDGGYRIWQTDRASPGTGRVLERGRWSVKPGGATPMLCLRSAEPAGVGVLFSECGWVTLHAGEAGTRVIDWQASAPRFLGFGFTGVAPRAALVLDERTGRLAREGGDAYFAFEVEEPVAIAGEAPPPPYPATLDSAGIPGQALLQFVVDTAGRADSSTIAALASSHPDFSAAARRAVLAWRFTPAIREGRRVRQIAELPFSFAPRRQAGDSAPAAEPVFAEDEVQKSVRRVAGSPHPRYPQPLIEQGIEGLVVIRFVVDTSGRIDESTVRVLRATDRAFLRAVRDWLPRARFEPAEKDGRKVRQGVVQPFHFHLRP